MAIYSRLSLKYKILSIALISALGFASYVAYHFEATQTNDKRLERIQVVNYPILEKIGVIWLELFAARSALQDAISESEINLIKQAQVHQTTIEELLQTISTLAPQYSSNTDTLDALLKKYISTASKLTTGLINGEMELGNMRQLAQAMNEEYAEFSDSLKGFRA